MLRPAAFPCFVLLALLTTSVSAHDRHEAPGASPSSDDHPASAETGAASAADTALEPYESAPVVVDPATALREHPHNKIVHFPVALGIAGGLMLLLSYRWPQFGPGARLLLVLAALMAWIAVPTGIGQEEALSGGGLDEWLERHELAGKLSAAALTATAIAALVKRARAFQWLLALLAMGLLLVTGFLGGILAHTPV